MTLFLRNALNNDSSVLLSLGGGGFFLLWVLKSACRILFSHLFLAASSESSWQNLGEVIFPPHQQISGDNLLILYVKYYFYIYWDIVDWYISRLLIGSSLVWSHYCCSHCLSTLFIPEPRSKWRIISAWAIQMQFLTLSFLGSLEPPPRQRYIKHQNTTTHPPRSAADYFSHPSFAFHAVALLKWFSPPIKSPFNHAVFFSCFECAFLSFFHLIPIHLKSQFSYLYPQETFTWRLQTSCGAKWPQAFPECSVPDVYAWDDLFVCLSLPPDNKLFWHKDSYYSFLFIQPFS